MHTRSFWVSLSRIMQSGVAQVRKARLGASRQLFVTRLSVLETPTQPNTGYSVQQQFNLNNINVRFRQTPTHRQQRSSDWCHGG